MLSELLYTVGLFAAFLAAVTQVVKVQLGLKGRVVFVVSLALGMAFGALFALGGLMEFKALRSFPDLASGLVTGLLSGLGASGGKDFLSGVQRNGVRARAEYDARFRQEQQAGEAPTAPNDGWEDTTPGEVERMTRTDWAAVPGLDDALPTWR